MPKEPLFFLMLTILMLSAAPGPGDLEHPGGLHTRAQLETARTAVAAARQPWTDAYDALLEQADLAFDKTSEAVADFNVLGFYQDADGHRTALRTLAADAWAAYACAVAWQLRPGEARLRYADKAVELLDAWVVPTLLRTTSPPGSVLREDEPTGNNLEEEEGP